MTTISPLTITKVFENPTIWHIHSYVKMRHKTEIIQIEGPHLSECIYKFERIVRGIETGTQHLIQSACGTSTNKYINSDSKVPVKYRFPYVKDPIPQYVPSVLPPPPPPSKSMPQSMPKKSMIQTYTPNPNYGSNGRIDNGSRNHNFYANKRNENYNDNYENINRNYNFDNSYYDNYYQNPNYDNNDVADSSEDIIVDPILASAKKLQEKALARGVRLTCAEPKGEAPKYTLKNPTK